MHFDYALILVILVAVTGFVWLLDVLFLARSRKHPAAARPRRSVAVEYARSFFPVLALILGVRTCLAEPFQIPSGSMEPTLLVGDYILVNKFSYGVRLPVTNTKVLDIGQPQRGDLVVFRPPWAPGEHWIKRVVGLPGDEVTYRDKTLYVNGERMSQSDARADVTTEHLGSIDHRIMKMPMRQAGQEGTWTVPPGHYFMMGDSRDNSVDSRYMGFVPEANLVGKAFAIWMNLDHGVDFSRIGTVLR